jgi:hypothetical protein
VTGCGRKVSIRFPVREFLLNITSGPHWLQGTVSTEIFFLNVDYQSS